MRGSRFYFFSLRLLTPLCRAAFRVKYAGIENIPDTGGFLLCSNHKSVYDAILLAMPFGRQIRFMGKIELFRDHGPFFRALLYRLGVFPVNRGRGDVSAVRTSEEILDAGGIVGIFPQGKCVFGNEPFRPKAGAALIASDTKRAVLPASVFCDGRLKPFRRVTVRFGKLIPYDELFAGGGSRAGVREAAGLIADRVNELLEKKDG